MKVAVDNTKQERWVETMIQARRSLLFIAALSLTTYLLTVESCHAGNKLNISVEFSSMLSIKTL